MSQHSHEIVKCRCGKVLAQCRCFGPKWERINDGPCPHYPAPQAFVSPASAGIDWSDVDQEGAD